ncbi:MAG TPA: hypothetical protein VN036_00090 [Devosia sp.]|nr:hypothetical protein [Devosia sp.]
MPAALMIDLDHCSTAETSRHPDIMITADMRLYAAKRSGGDRTVWCDADQRRHVG